MYMKNTGSKIIILSVFAAVAVALVLAFYHTIVTPPIDVPISNLHKANLESNIKGFTDKERMFYNDSLYNRVVYKLMMCRNEEFITYEESDSLTIALVNTYVPVFKKLCDDKFSDSEWIDSDHEIMLKKILMLRSLTVENDSVNVVEKTQTDGELNKVEETIKLYREARKVAEYSNFYSVEDANAKIQEAEYYMSISPLSNCLDLVRKLSGVRGKIGESHYRTVENIVNRLKNYQNMTEDDFYSLFETVKARMKEYENNRHRYGTYAENTNQLKRTAKMYYDEARENFKKIEIGTNNAWMPSLSSPNSSYRAFESFSNYNEHNSEAVMYFTIKGYKEFKFYIRSNGESDHDYVIVGLDYKPTREKNYASTKNSPRSGTSMSDYKEVSLQWLDASKPYTIYVVYVKDSSENYGTDRGYVLIPNKK